MGRRDPDDERQSRVHQNHRERHNGLHFGRINVSKAVRPLHAPAHTRIQRNAQAASGGLNSGAHYRTELQRT